MIEIAKNLLLLIANSINSLFNVQIELSETETIPLGFLLVGVSLLAIGLVCLFNILNRGDDD